MGRRKYIATRLHRAIDMAPEDLADFTDKPHYVLDNRLVEAMSREDMARSIDAVIEAGMFRLPFPEIVIEFEAPDDPVRRIVLATEVPGADYFVCTVATLRSPALTVTKNPIRVFAEAGSENRLFGESDDAVSDLDIFAAGFACASSMLLLNIAGIEKEVLTPTKLNRARVQSGKPSIPRHTLLRIGTVVTRDGETIQYNSGRNMPVHMRAGHTRRQHHGKGNELTKIVYIPPTLVNFKGGDESIPQPKKLVTV